MQQTIKISIPAHNGLYDITRQVEAIAQVFLDIEESIKTDLTVLDFSI